MPIETRYLHTLVAAAEYGSLRRAADALEAKQSTLSRHISQLERELGVQLLERSSGGVRVTAAGYEVVRTSRRLLEQMDCMTSIARSAGRGAAGCITIGTSASPAANRLRALLIEYLQAFPNIEIRIVEHARAKLITSVATGAIDIAIVAGEAKDHAGPSLLLWSERIIVALPAGHRLTNNAIIYWTDLKEEPFLLSRRGPGPDLHGLIVQKLGVSGEIVDVACWCAGYESVLAMLDVRQNVSVQCESYTALAYPGVVFREVRDATGPSYVTFAACWERENTNPALARFVDLLRKHHPQTVT